ncbi:MAG: hypothetical protein B6D73_11500 [gamma proteobacterium symbiont of Stewartia floridana]|nr:MAG: hypothetical protein B6D73_11500 [gamma proteobacterium symbiont of Stewartia floridana]
MKGTRQAATKLAQISLTCLPNGIHDKFHKYRIAPILLQTLKRIIGTFLRYLSVRCQAISINVNSNRQSNTHNQ